MGLVIQSIGPKDDNFSPTHGFPVQSDPNGPNFTQSNKE